MPQVKTGIVVPLRFESRLLRRNPLGDPHLRSIPIYLPPSYFLEPERSFPVIYVLSGFAGRGTMMLNDALWSESIDRRVERLIRRKRMVETIVVMPDGATGYGGSQYLNSVANGRYEDHIVRELVPFIDRHYRTIRKPAARALTGKSSGGYGSIVLGMRHPGVFGLVACHSGDMYFELCYKPDFHRALKAAGRFGGFKAFFGKFPRMRQKNNPDVFAVLNTIAMSMCYSPRKNRKAPFELPFDERTGEMREAVWRKWLRWDPVEMAARYRSNLKKLKLLYFDCGIRDEFQLHFGARILAERLRKMKVRHIHEEFEDGHRSIQYRFDRSLPLISSVFRKNLRLRA
jgi:enterochelin esterase family protein